VRRRWPILDVHDVKQRNAILPRAPKRSASASNSVMYSRRLSRRASRARRYIQPDGVPARVGEAEATHAQARTGRNRCRCLSLWTIRSLLPVRRRAGPPPD
jgi:hypothetical protein